MPAALVVRRRRWPSGLLTVSGIGWLLSWLLGSLPDLGFWGRDIRFVLGVSAILVGGAQLVYRVQLDEAGVRWRCWYGVGSASWEDVRRVRLPDAGWLPWPVIRIGRWSAVRLPNLNADWLHKTFDVRPATNPAQVAATLARSHGVTVDGDSVLCRTGQAMMAEFLGALALMAVCAWLAMTLR